MYFEKHVFISDVHLGAFSKEQNQRIEQDLIVLINHCKENRCALYVLGDLFDYWMEYPQKNYVPELGSKVLDAFEEYNKTVKPALFITGNHDNWTFGHFEDRGFEVETNFRLLDINETRFLLMHGDGVASSDINFPRKVFHRLLRNKLFVKIYQFLLPPGPGLKTMKVFSSMTRKSNRQRPEDLNDKAEEIFKNHNLDFILTGHDHFPREKQFPEGIYINLGTFFKHRSVAVYNNKELNLVVWDAGTENFLSFVSSTEIYE